MRIITRTIYSTVTSTKLAPSGIRFIRVGYPLIRTGRGDYRRHDDCRSVTSSHKTSTLKMTVTLGRLRQSRVAPSLVNQSFDLCSGATSASTKIRLRGYRVFILNGTTRTAKGLIIDRTIVGRTLSVTTIRRTVTSAKRPMRQIIGVFTGTRTSPGNGILGHHRAVLSSSSVDRTHVSQTIIKTIMTTIIQSPVICISNNDRRRNPPKNKPMTIVTHVT